MKGYALPVITRPGASNRQRHTVPHAGGCNTDHLINIAWPDHQIGQPTRECCR